MRAISDCLQSHKHRTNLRAGCRGSMTDFFKNYPCRIKLLNSYLWKVLVQHDIALQSTLDLKAIKRYKSIRGGAPPWTNAWCSVSSLFRSCVIRTRNLTNHQPG